MATLSLSGIGDKIAAMVHAATHRNFPRVLANSMPKSGTHLLTRLLTLLEFREADVFLDVGPYKGMERISVDCVKRTRNELLKIRPGFFAGAHMYFYTEIGQVIDELQIKTITIVRDPRDVCVSDIFHIVKRPEHRLHPYYKNMSQEERLMASIIGMDTEQLNGEAPSLDIGTHYRNYLGWITQGGGLVIKFEDLVGHKGGGDDQIQRETTERIIHFLELRLSKEKITDLCTQLFWTGAKTFRKGQIGSWREYFKSRHVKAFEQVIGSIMHDFGYVDW